MSVPRRITAFLDLAEQDVEAASTLAAMGNRYSAYHCQQAAEKLTTAVLLHTNVETGAEHRLDVLIGRLPDDNPWKLLLRPLEHYSPYATAFRYPTPGGRIVPAADPKAVLTDAEAVRELIQRARTTLR